VSAYAKYVEFLRQKIRLADFAGFEVGEDEVNPMIRLAALVAMAVVLGGCGATNDQNIASFKKCNDAGMGSTMNAFGVVICTVPGSQMRLAP
jgi:hypothetical protein